MIDNPREFLVKRIPICSGCRIEMHRNGKGRGEGSQMRYYKCPQCKATCKTLDKIIPINHSGLITRPS